MDLHALILELQQAETDLHTIKAAQQPIEARFIEDEVPLTLHFVQKIFPFSKKIQVSGTEAILLYVFESNGKTLISPEVYVTKEGQVMYEVYDEAGYRRFRPMAIIEDGYNKIQLDEFLYIVPFHEIIQFYKDRVNVLYENAESIVEANKFRKAFNEKMKRFLAE